MLIKQFWIRDERVKMHEKKKLLQLIISSGYIKQWKKVFCKNHLALYFLCFQQVYQHFKSSNISDSQLACLLLKIEIPHGAQSYYSSGLIATLNIEKHQNLNSHLLPLFISYRSSGEKLIRCQANASCVIMYLILMTTLFHKAWISQGEIWFRSLLGLKGLSDQFQITLCRL